MGSYYVSKIDTHALERYYPFGHALRGTNPIQPNPDYHYAYNGKEKISGTGLYAYGFRYYDPLTARFTGVDPISDQFAFVSVYNYAENSPVRNIDLHGLQKWDTVLNDLAKFFGITTGLGPGNNNNPRTARQADQYTGRKAALTKTNEQLETVAEVQAAFIPGGGAMLEARKGNHGQAAGELGLDLVLSMAPPLKVAKGARPLLKNADEVVDAAKNIPGDNLAFGLLRFGLEDFAKKFNFKTFRQFTSGGFKPREIKEAIDTSTNNLHISLDGMSGFRYSQFDPTKPATLGNITNWELHTIVNTPGALQRTKFYRNGVESSIPYWLK